jgi:hypothetical protein
MGLTDWTDRELIHERFHWEPRDGGWRMLNSAKELERRGYQVFRRGQPMSEENLLGQEILRRREEVR